MEVLEGRLQASRGTAAGDHGTMVSILCSSEPFSRACLSSFWEGTSAALSWWTC